MNTETTIHDAIVKLVASATFTPAALKMMQDSLDNVKHLELTVKMLQQERSLTDKKVIAVESKIKSLEITVAENESRENKLKARESFVNETEKNAAVSVATSNAYKDVFDKIFKNVNVRETLTKSIPIVMPGYSGSPSYVQNQTETTTTDTTRE